MLKYTAILLVFLLLLNCRESNSDEKKYQWKTKEVTASAFNSLAYQTNSNPSITAFGDSLKPGMKCIAVSRNLLSEGLGHNTQLTIEGLKGIYLVKDKMNRRFTDKIDIYMGTDVQAARNWGVKKVSIQYRVELTEDETANQSP